MNWSTGRHTSVPDDGRAFLETDNEGLWVAYKTGSDGRLMEGFPKLRNEPFDTVEAAQAWVEANVPPHENYEPDALSRAVASGKTKIVWAENEKVDDLQPWVDLILKANGIKRAYVSDQSTMGDFYVHNAEARHSEVQERLGIAFEPTDYVHEVAKRLRDRPS